MMGTDEPLGAVYRCPICEFGTLDLRTLKNHWMRAHADEHGTFRRADVEVIG